MERWLLTYADMITLLLALFIVLFAMSTIDVVRFEALKRTLSQTFKGEVLQEPGAVTDGSKGALDPTAPSLNDPAQAFQLQDVDSAKAAAQQKIDKSFNDEAKRLENEIARMAKDNKSLEGKLEVTTSERGVIVRLAGDTYFESGSAQLREELKKTLIPIARDLKANHRQVRIEGHTDGAPIATAQYPSNLDLSLARASSVYHFLEEQGVHLKSAEGFGDRVPLVKPSPDNPHESIARNRRVEIVILVPGGDTFGQSATYGHKPVIGGNQDSGGSGAAPADQPARSKDETINIIGDILTV